MSRRIMRTFKMTEISAVDRPAQAHARAVLMKREFSADERGKDAKSGAALPDGSFPIENRGDLHNAIQAIGRAKDQDRARRHIIARARSLGAVGDLPSSWNVGKVNEMSEENVAKMAEIEKAAKETAEKLAELTKSFEIVSEENAILKMEPTHREYMDNLKGDERAAFIAKSAEERAAYIKANDLEAKLPESVRKALDQARKDSEVLKALRDREAKAEFAKRATDIGLDATQGEMLRKAYEGDAEGIKGIEALIKGLNEQIAKGDVFKEIGGKGASAGSAADEIAEKADAFRAGQIAVGKSLSKEQAWTAVYLDPANADLKGRYDREDMAKRFGGAV